MSDSFTFFAYYTDADARLASADALNNLVKQYRRSGWTLLDGLAHPFDKPANEIPPGQETEERIAKQLDDSSGVVRLSFYKSLFEFAVTVDAGQCMQWMVDANMETLRGPKNDRGEANATLLLDALRIVLEHYTPYFGCGTADDREIPPLDAGADLKVTDVYPVNFYSKELLKKQLDAQALKQVQAWRTEELAGGLLFVPDAQPLFGGDAASLEQARRAIGLPRS